MRTAQRKPNGKVLAITSGKGGVGKTFISANLAAALANRGLKVLVLDADLGLANLDVVLNLYPKLTLHDVFTGKTSLEEAIVQAPGGFSALLAGSGMVEYSKLTTPLRENLSKTIACLVQHYDLILLDTGAGISEVVLFSISLASEILIVATPEPSALTDAYATIKVLIGQQQRKTVRILANQSTRLGDGRAITVHLQQVLDRFVSTDQGPSIKLLHMGDIPNDPNVRQAIMRRQLLLQSFPSSPAALALVQLAQKVQKSCTAPASGT